MSTTETAAPQGNEISAAARALHQLGVPSAISATPQCVQDEDGNPSALFLGTNKVVANVVQADPQVDSFVISAGKSALYLGGSGTYSWIQSHAGQPLHLNPIGNFVVMATPSTAYVGIGTDQPKAKLDVAGTVNAKALTVGDVKADSLTVKGTLTVGALTLAGPSFRITNVPSATTAPNGGSTLKVLFVDPATGSLYAL